jgi:hypothetical protein
MRQDVHAVVGIRISSGRTFASGRARGNRAGGAGTLPQNSERFFSIPVRIEIPEGNRGNIKASWLCFSLQEIAGDLQLLLNWSVGRSLKLSQTRRTFFEIYFFSSGNWGVVGLTGG